MCLDSHIKFSLLDSEYSLVEIREPTHEEADTICWSTRQPAKAGGVDDLASLVMKITRGAKLKTIVQIVRAGLLTQKQHGLIVP